MDAMTTRKPTLTILRARMKGVKPRSPQVAVTVKFHADAVSIDAACIPAEVPAALVGTSATLNGFLLLELLNKLKKLPLLAIGFSDENRLTIQAGSFSVALIPQEFERPGAPASVTETKLETPQATHAEPKPRKPRRTRRYNGLTQVQAYAGHGV